jgi:hypothetical protein
MSTRDLVNALVAGDSIAIENTFNTAMSEKISAALDDYRVKIAQNMFAAEEQEELSVDDNTEQA